MYVGKDKCDFCGKKINHKKGIWRTKDARLQFCKEDCALDYELRKNLKEYEESDSKLIIGVMIIILFMCVSIIGLGLQFESLEKSTIFTIMIFVGLAGFFYLKLMSHILGWKILR